MAVTALDAASGSGNSNTLTYSVSAGSNRALVVMFHCAGPSTGTQSPPSSVTYGAEALTKVHDATSASGQAEGAAWYLLDAGIAASTSTVISAAGFNGNDKCITARSYQGVNQTSPISHSTYGSGTSFSVSDSTDNSMTVQGYTIWDAPAGTYNVTPGGSSIVTERREQQDSECEGGLADAARTTGSTNENVDISSAGLGGSAMVVLNLAPPPVGVVGYWGTRIA